MSRKKSSKPKNSKKLKTSDKQSSFHRKKWKKVVLDFIKSDDFSPMKEATFFTQLKVPKKDLNLVRDILGDLRNKGIIEFQRKRITLPPEPQKTITGTIHIHPRGFGFVVPENNDVISQDVFIPKHLVNKAIDSDQVEIIVFTSSIGSEKGPEGKVTRVISRSKNHLVATICEIADDKYYAYCPTLPDEKSIIVRKDKKFSLKDGDRILVSIESWDDNPSGIITRPEKILGNINDPKTDIPVAIEEYGIPKSFSKEIQASLKDLSDDPKESDLKNRLDFTGVETLTIDPDTARDFDDALTLEINDDKNYELGVHIADVSAYVKEGSEIDKEAHKRAVSTYFPGECVPMLPEKLSNGLCSLKENVIRLCVSVFMEFDKKGECLSYDIQRSFIKSDKRFTYKQARDVLDGKEKSPHLKTLKNMRTLCRLLQKQRKERGSIELSLPEIALKMSPLSVPDDFEVVEYDITHQMVEEFMLKANEIVAYHLLENDCSAIFRIHEAPSQNDFQDFLHLANQLGFKPKKNPDKDDFQKIFDEAKKTPYLHQLSVAFIRSMKLAIYSENNIGHYGLSLEHYCHFTSPIRRYSDLVIHRLLFSKKAYNLEQLSTIATHCSERERVSYRAEMSVTQLKKIRLINSWHDDEPKRIYEAIISKVKPFGVTFEVMPLMIEGFLHISQLDNDYYHYKRQSQTLIGERLGKSIRSGMTIHIQIEAIQLITRDIRWKFIKSPKKNT